MGSDSMMNKGSVPVYPKEFGKKKRANRLAKLKQEKLDARREQWLSKALGDPFHQNVILYETINFKLNNRNEMIALHKFLWHDMEYDWGWKHEAEAAELVKIKLVIDWREVQ